MQFSELLAARSGVSDEALDARATEVEAEAARRAAKREAAERSEHWQSLQKALGTRYGDCTLDGFQVYDDRQRGVLVALTGYADDIPARAASGDGLVLLGKPGTGKDHLLAALMRVAVLSHGIRVHWVNGQDFYGRVRDRIDGTGGTTQSEAALLKELIEPQVLVMSDPIPPVGPLSPFQMATLFRVIDGRYRNCKATWITVNVTSDREAAERMGAAVVDRLTDGCVVLACNWESFRTRRRETR